MNNESFELILPADSVEREPLWQYFQKVQIIFSASLKIKFGNLELHFDFCRLQAVSLFLKV